MMQNVIAFPKTAVEQPVVAAKTGAKTLFLHIRQTTLIMHLAAQDAPAAVGTKLGRL